jgi:enterochelin esterase family protein
MKKLIQIIFLLSISIHAQNQFTEFINHVNSLPDSASKAAVVDSFMTYARPVGIPFIEENEANFIYLGSVSNISVAGDFNNWNSNSEMMIKLVGTRFWYKTNIFELNARLDYKFVRNGSDWILDPENPNICTGGFGENSELAMPEYIQPWEIKYNNSIQHGTVEVKNLFSTNTNSNYQIKIYLPPAYDSSSASGCPSVYFQDGYEYVDLAHSVNVIDNLLDSNKIQKIIGVFVRPNNRNEEYAFSKRNQYRMFFVNELVPFIDSVYNTIPEASKRLVLGDSYGGNISALISCNHSDIFGNCGLHSAAFQPNNYEAFNLIVNGPPKDIKFCSIWGTYESLFTNMINFRDSLLSKGYQLKWIELPEGHSWGLWRATIDDMLEYFFPPLPSDVKDYEEISPEGFNLYQNYPNPFNPITNIGFRIADFGFVTLKIYDSLGREVAALVNERKPPGTYKVEFADASLSSGIYFYSLGFNGFFETKSMVFLK